MEQQGEKWRLLDLVVDTGTQTVVRGEEAIQLPKLSFQFLLELIRAAPNVLSNDVLMNSVWAGIFINPETVTQRAKLLRDSLGDDPADPRYFHVRRGVGYQLVATPERLDPAETVLPGHLRRSRRWKAIAAGLAVFLTGGLGIAFYDRLAVHEVRSHSLRIAVLPFDNLSDSPADAYIAQGLPEMILNRLSSVPGLTVIARNSALLSSKANAAPNLAGKALDAEFIVKGSVQRSGDTLRVTCFVLDTTRNTRLWSQSFDWPVARLYELQDRIAQRVAESLTMRAAYLGVLPQATSGTSTPDAYLAFLKGKSLLGRLSVAETEAAAFQFQRAVDLDSGFAPAMVALYDARMQAASLRSEDLAPVRARYQPLLAKARQIAPNLGAALFADAMWSNRPRAERLAMFEQAAANDPSNSRGLTAYSRFVEWGQSDEARSPLGQQLMDRVMAIDPLSADAQFWSVQRSVSYSRSPRETEDAMRRALALDPDNLPLANRFAMRRWRIAGQTAEAIGLMERVIARDPQYARSAQIAVAMYLDVGDLSAARQVAASTPATRQSARAVIALYEGDWRGAGEAALGPHGFVFNPFENWLWPEAVRDFTLKTGEHERGAQAIATRFGFDLANPRVLALYQTSAAVPLAQIFLASGKRDQATRLLSGTVQWIDEHPMLGLEGGTGRSEAQALLLLGQEDQALSVLLAATRSAHDIRHCWYLSGQDPVWAPVHGDPRFREVSDICASSIRTQRAILEKMRSAGKVPLRRG